MLKLNLFRQNECIQRSNSKIDLKYKKKDKIIKVVY